MAIAEIGAIIGAVVSILISMTGVDQVLGSVNTAAKNKFINDQIKPLAEEITKNRALANQLLRAYQNQDISLASSLIGGSSFGTRYKNLKAELDKVRKNINTVSKTIEQQDLDLNQLERQKQMIAEESTGSFLGDLIVESNKLPANPSGSISKAVKKVVSNPSLKVNIPGPTLFSQRRMNPNHE